MWQGVIHGQSTSTMWVWERWSEGRPDGFKGSILHRPACVEAMGRTNLDANRLASEVVAFQEVDSPVALLYSVTSNVYTGEHKQRLNQAYAAASLAGVEVDVVTEDIVQDGELSSYEVVVVPRATHVDEATASGVADYATGGDGNLIVVGDDSLSRGPYDATHQGVRRSAVMNTARVVETDASEDQFKTAIRESIGNADLRDVVVRDSDGNVAEGVEWRSVMHDGRRLVNVANYTSETQTLSIEIDDESAGDGRELLEREPVSGGEIEVGPELPALIAFDN
jgi:beta-galactosidase GanA